MSNWHDTTGYAKKPNTLIKDDSYTAPSVNKLFSSVASSILPFTSMAELINKITNTENSSRPAKSARARNCHLLSVECVFAGGQFCEFKRIWPYWLYITK